MTWLKTGDEHNNDARWLSFRRGAERALYQGYWHQVATWAAGDQVFGNGLVPIGVPRDFGARPAVIERMVDAGWWHTPGELCPECAAHPLTADPGRDQFVICHWWLHIEDRDTVAQRREHERQKKKLQRQRQVARLAAELAALSQSPGDTPGDTPGDSQGGSQLPARPGPARPDPDLSVVALSSNGGVATGQPIDGPPQCSKHQGMTETPPCGNCRTLRLRWESEQDRLRAEVAAELAEQSAARAAADRQATTSAAEAAKAARARQRDPAVIAACTRCDDAGKTEVTTAGRTRRVPCSHAAA